MSKLIIFACFAIAAWASPPPAPTAEQAKSELVAAGVSDSTATGIIAIAQKYRSQFESGKSDPETAKAAFKDFHTEVDGYMKTQSSEDQTAYTAFVEKKKAEHQARKESSA